MRWWCWEAVVVVGKEVVVEEDEVVAWDDDGEIDVRLSYRNHQYRIFYFNKCIITQET